MAQPINKLLSQYEVPLRRDFKYVTLFHERMFPTNGACWDVLSMVVESKRISVTLPAELIEDLDAYIAPHERSELIADLLYDYVDALLAEDERVSRVEARKEQTQLWLERLKDSGRRAADMFLP